MSNWQGRRVLVTGAYGFLAGHLIETLLEQHAEVVGLVRDCPAESYLQSRGLDSRITRVNGELTDLDGCRRAINEHEIEVVFHLAAQAIVGMANRSPLSTFESNIRGTYVLLEACRELWTDKSPFKAVVCASSDKAYGDQEELPYREDAPLLGLHPYDASKSCADLIARAYHKTYGLPVAVTRCANLFGPGDLNFSRIVPATAKSVIEHERPIIRSDGSPKRDYLYVKDAAEGYLTLADAVISGIASGRAYNLGTGVPVTVLQLVDEIIKAAGSELTPDVQGTASSEIQHQYLDPTRAREELGWEARTPLAQGLTESLAWYKGYCADHV
ncbi:MAG: GDP-mannose 4,6-dehydratase [Armatimonadota bacterium]